MNVPAVLRSRPVAALVAAVAVAVPIMTLTELPAVSLGPLLVGLLPWLVAKHVLVPLRWRALTDSGMSRWWHIRAYAEAELIGLFTPGGIGSDVWRYKRLTRIGLTKSQAVSSVAVDTLVGTIGLGIFVVCAGAALPPAFLLVGGGLALGTVLAVVAVRIVRPDLLAARPWPSRRVLVKGLALSAIFHAATAGLVLAALAATGHSLPPLAIVGAFGASQVAGAIPGPNGAGPKDGVLVAGLVALGVPVASALAAVALVAGLAWLPAITLGGGSLVGTYRSMRTRVAAALPAPQAGPVAALPAAA